MTILDEVKKRVEEVRVNVAARQRGEKPETKMPVINAVRSNIETRIREHRLILKKKEGTQTPITIPPIPPQTSTPPASPPSTPTTESKVSERERQKIYI